MTLLQLMVLAAIQGLAELLPVSSSAHVIAVAKLMGLDPSSPQFTLLLVMLHTGTMFAVILYFWRSWKRAFFESRVQFERFVLMVVIATVVTGLVGVVLKFGIEAVIRHRHPGIEKAEVEQLFSHLDLLAGALAAAGVLILVAGLRRRRGPGHSNLAGSDSIIIGLVQGLCLPFRGFSRSGATISVGLMRGLNRRVAEEFSFALAVVLTPVVVLYEGRRLIAHHAESSGTPITVHDLAPSLLGMVLSFAAGLVALRLLSRVLEGGKWWAFGVYCLVAAAVVFGLHVAGY